MFRNIDWNGVGLAFAITLLIWGIIQLAKAG